MPQDQKIPTGCFLPEHALTINPQGQFHFCLSSRLAAQETREQLQEKRLRVQSDFAAGRWPDSCTPCRVKEERGIQSRRTYTWKRKLRMYGEALPTQLNKAPGNFALRHLDLSFSNSCNFSCAMCSSEFSSGWIGHDRRACEEGLSFRNFTQPYQKIVRIRPETVDYILDQVANLDLIIIKGGEPTRDTLCLDFLARLAKLPGPLPAIFVQSNGSTEPAKWLASLEGLEFGVGVSMDGWETVFNWIRGPYFDKVLENLRQLERYPNVSFVTINFTLSAFNVLHLPEFLSQIVSLRGELAKLKECPVSQWAQESYASPLALPEEVRAEVVEQILPLFAKTENFFLDHEELTTLLRRPRLADGELAATRQWYDYLNKIRGFGLGATAPRLEALLR